MTKRLEREWTSCVPLSQNTSSSASRCAASLLLHWAARCRDHHHVSVPDVSSVKRNAASKPAWRAAAGFSFKRIWAGNLWSSLSLQIYSPSCWVFDLSVATDYWWLAFFTWVMWMGACSCAKKYLPLFLLEISNCDLNWFLTRSLCSLHMLQDPRIISPLANTIYMIWVD